MIFSATYGLARYSWIPSAAVICAAVPVGVSFAFAAATAVAPLSLLPDGTGRRLRYKALESGLYMFQHLINLVLEQFNTVELVWHGDKLPEGQENVIVLSNHQCSMDWMLIGMLASRQDSPHMVRFLMKDSLKHVPMVGGYLNMIGSVYIKRGSGDCEGMRRRLDHFVVEKRPLWWVLFPEGTRYDVSKPERLVASQQFAQERGLPCLRQVLLPKTKGVEVSLETLRGHCQAVYDLTIAYTSRDGTRSQPKRTSAPSMLDFGAGKCSRVDIHIERIDINDIPADSDGCQEWLLNRFVVKDRMLNDMFTNHAGALVDDGYRWPQSLPKSLLSAFPLLASVALLAWPLGRTARTSVLLSSTAIGLIGCYACR